MTTVGTFGLFAVLIYTCVLLGVSFRSARIGAAGSTGKKFYLGSGTGTFVLLFSMMASSFSTWVIMGAPVTTYTSGHTWIALITLYQMTLSFVCGYLGPRFLILRKRFDFLTHADLLVEYYQTNSVRYLLGTCFLLGLATTTIAQFKAMGTAISAMTGGALPYWACALYVMLAIAIYIFFGGFHGTALIDTFQGVLFTIILFGGLFVALTQIGGLSNMFDLIAAKDMRLVLYGTGADALWPANTAISFCIVAVVGGFFSAGFWQRYYAAKNTGTLIRMSLWFPLLVSVGVSLTGGLVGLSAHAFTGVEIADASTVFQTLLAAISSPYWHIAVVIGVLAAGMSTVAGNMNGVGLITSYDFARNLGKGIPDSKLRNIGRAASLAAMTLMYIFSLRTPSSVTALVQLSTAFYSTALYPIIGIFLWKRATLPGVLAGMGGSLGGVIVTNFFIKNPLGIMAGCWGILIGLILFVVVSLCTKPVPAEQRARFMAPLKEARTKPETNVD